MAYGDGVTLCYRCDGGCVCRCRSCDPRGPRHTEPAESIALRQVRPAAERFCTANYQTTVIFEPFGGEFVVTRFGAKRFGWNNSQPLDIKHHAGYDLTTGAGRNSPYEVLGKHWTFLTILAFTCTVWSIMHNLNQDPDLEQLWQREDVWLVRGEQRAYKRATGYMTNSQIITNQVARQRSCTVEHQPLMGNYKFGSRTKQATCGGVQGQTKFDYAMNSKLDAAICGGVRGQMKFDYAMNLSAR